VTREDRLEVERGVEEVVVRRRAGSERVLDTGRDYEQVARQQPPNFARGPPACRTVRLEIQFPAGMAVTADRERAGRPLLARVD
jgi:hypothetical protein